MPRGMVYSIYESDSGNTYGRLVDADEVLDANRGWDTTPDFTGGVTLLPIKFKPRRVYGISATTGRRGTAVVARPGANLWSGVATTFDVEANDNTTDTMTVTSRMGEKLFLPHL